MAKISLGQKKKREKLNRNNPRKNKRGGRKPKFRGQSEMDWNKKHKIV